MRMAAASRGLQAEFTAKHADRPAAIYDYSEPTSISPTTSESVELLAHRLDTDTS